MSQDITEQKNIEKALIESEMRYRAFFEQAADSIVLIDAETGTLAEFNDKAHESLGYSRKEFKKLRITGFEVIESEEEVARHIKKIIMEGSDSFETKHRAKDGQIQNIQVNCKAISVGGREFIQAIWSNITERKKAEKEIKKAYNKWETTFNSINDLVSIHDRKFNLLRVNKTFADAFKKNGKELIGKKCYEVIHGTNEPWPNCPLKQTVDTGRPVTEEFFEPELGSYLQVSTSPVFDENGELTDVVHIAKDITERKKAEETIKTARDDLKLKVKERTAELESTVDLLKKEISGRKKMEEELLFKTALLEAQSQTSIDGLLAVDSEGNVISFNERMKEMWGVPEELWKTGDDKKLLQYAATQLKEPDEFIKKVEYLYSHNELKSRDEIELKNGKCFDRYSSPLKDSRGKYYGRAWYFRDITDYKKIVNELRETEKELKIRAEELLESNVALKVLLRQREEDRKDFEKNILANMKHLVLPYLTKLKRNRTPSQELTYMNILESNLKEIISPFSQKLSSIYANFTPKEIQIADLIKDGKHDKDIMEILNISIDTIKSHRKNIRKKLGIYSKKVNLRTKLLSLI